MTENIWLSGVKAIIGFTKRSLLDYVDAIEASANSAAEKERLGKIKGKIHNDLSQASFHIGTLIVTLQSGGDISPFQVDILKRPEKEKEEKVSSGLTQQPFKNLGK